MNALLDPALVLPEDIQNGIIESNNCAMSLVSLSTQNLPS